MNNYKNIAHKAGQFIPEGVKESALDLELLLKAYYEWGDQTGQFQKESKKIIENFSIKTADDKSLDRFKLDMLRMFPESSTEITRHLLKFSKLFYSERGTPDSYKFLFKVLWDDHDMELEYPTEFIMKSSDGVWKTTDMMYIDKSTYTYPENLEGKLLVGRDTKVRTFVSEETIIDDTFSLLLLENISGNFNINEIIDVYSDINSNNYIGSCRTVASIGDYEIVDPGHGYIAGRNIPLISDGDGEGFKISISGVDSITGKITKLSIDNTGNGYLYSKPKLDFTDVYLFDVTKSKREVANIALKFVANFKETGHYSQKKSMLSDNWKLRDGHYYQEYSYVIKSKMDKSIVEKPVLELLHPAGLAMFYERVYDDRTRRYIDLSSSKFDVISSTTKKSDGRIRYSNYNNYNDRNSIYM